MRLAPGDKLGRYTIEMPLGEGGTGVVYRALDTVLGRRVALKLVRAEASQAERSAPTAAARLLHEARAAATLEHVHAVAIYDVGEVDGAPYIAMELVPGRSLRSYVGASDAPLATRIGWLRDVARVLDAAHARGLVHRDVKPENVMVRDDGAVKVLDFGIAWLEGTMPPIATGASDRAGIVEAWRTTLTRYGALMGTPRYMAPEQILGEPVDARADQFSWGVMAYELLTGSPPWLADPTTLTGVLDVLDREPPPIDRLAPFLPADVKRVIVRALQKAPPDRFPSMGAVADALDRVLRAPSSKRRLAAVALATVAVAVVGAGSAALRAQRASGASAASAAARPPIAPPASASITPPVAPARVVLRLDAADGVERAGGSVTRWADQSGLGNDAVAVGPKPTFIADAFHGHAAVHFEGGQYLAIADAASLRFGQHDFAVLVVARHRRPYVDDAHFRVATSYGVLFSKQSSQAPFEGVGLFVNFPQPAPSTKFGGQTSWYNYAVSTTEGLNDDKPHVFALRRQGVDLIVLVDGVTNGRIAVQPDDVSAPNQPAFVGAHPENGRIIQQLDGEIAEIVAVDGTLDGRSYAELDGALCDKYGR